MIRSTIVLAVLAAALVTACGNSVTPSPSASASPAPSVTLSPSPASPSATPSATAAAACEPAEIVATGGPWGGAAGSRGSDVVVENRGPAACLLPAGPTVAAVDAGGAAILTSTPTQAGEGPEIAAGGSIRFSLVMGNWCDQSVNLPLHFRLALASDAVDIDALTAGTIDDLPPCNGPGQPPTLSTTEWQPG